MLRSQFARGLQEGPVKRELQRHLRRNPMASFEDVRSEARSLEREELGPLGEIIACQARATSASQPPIPEVLTQTSLQQMKDSLRAELRLELQDQMAHLGVTITNELRNQFQSFQPAQEPSQRWGQPPTGPPPRTQWRPDNREPRNYQWDEQGRPICVQCREAGHTQRYCPRRSAPPSDFRPAQSQQGK